MSYVVYQKVYLPFGVICFILVVCYDKVIRPVILCMILPYIFIILLLTKYSTILLPFYSFSHALPSLFLLIISISFFILKFSGKTVGIIGLGRIGMAVAKRAEAFNCPICYYSRTEKSDTKYKYYPSVVELASNCQILVVACPLTEETRHIVNREVMNALGPKGVLINIGRGPHVDEPELVSALIEGRLGGAGLDVYEHEPEVPEELFGLENVVLLPHVGTATVETRKAMADLVVGNLEAHFSNKPLLTPLV